jgi:ABC-2 type transport system ATP-binding protein
MPLKNLGARRLSRATICAGMSVIVLDSLTRSYGRRRGVEERASVRARGVSVRLPRPHGAGKTTTIRVLWLSRPTRGSARVFGFDCWRASRRIKAEVGYLPGDLRLYPWINGRDALRIFGAVRGRDLLRRGQELAEELDFDLRLKVRSMSRGTRQKLGLILALAHEPGSSSSTSRRPGSTPWCRSNCART